MYAGTWQGPGLLPETKNRDNSMRKGPLITEEYPFGAELL